jgi:hypothetical protein
MASDQDFVDYVCEQAGLGAALTYRKMSGEYALYLDERVVAFVCDNMLFVKPTAAGRACSTRWTRRRPIPARKCISAWTPCSMTAIALPVAARHGRRPATAETARIRQGRSKRAASPSQTSVGCSSGAFPEFCKRDQHSLPGAPDEPA